MFFRMDINKVLNNPRLVRAVLGVTKNEFQSLLSTFEQVLLEQQTAKKRKRVVGGGRIGKIKPAQNKLFFILWYLKVYPTYDVAAYVFASSKTKTHVWVKEILPLLEKTLERKITLPKRRIRSVEEFLTLYPDTREVLLDGVERPTVRSQKQKTQAKHYSGKKKRHVRKNVLMTDPKKHILYLSPTKHGRVHDKKLLDKHLSLAVIPKEVSIYADTGFQGIQPRHPNCLVPKKKPRGGELTTDEKLWNQLISSYRIVVEHAISGMKRYRAFSDIFRGRRGQDDLTSHVIAGLWNFHLQLQAT
jgi:hypothetical protein